MRSLALTLALIAAPLFSQETLRGEVLVNLESVPSFSGEALEEQPRIDGAYSIDVNAIHRAALGAAALFFGGMIYGWTFDYEIGEKARGIAENLELNPVETIRPGDSRLRVTDARLQGPNFHLWADYNLDEAQSRSFRFWRSGAVKNAQASGACPVEEALVQALDKALQDAARQALRELLRAWVRNRPRSVRGCIALAAFPKYGVDQGRWVVSARFRVEVTEIVPFAAY